MQCPSCGFENASSSTYCEECGTLLSAPPYAVDQTEYQAPQTEYGAYTPPSPPPLNGNNALPEYNELPPPPTEYSSYGMQSQAFTNQQFISRPGLAIFSTILYFMGALIAALGLLVTVTTFSASALTGGIALLLGIVLLIVSIIVFIRIRGRFPLLRWWQRILWIVAITVGGFIVLIIETILVPNPTVTNFFIGCIFILYGLAWAAIAVW
jgi:hypothetical protein